MSAVIWERDPNLPTPRSNRFEVQRISPFDIGCGWRHSSDHHWLWRAKWEALGWASIGDRVRIIDHNQEVAE